MNIKSNILLRIYLVGAFCLLFGIAVLAKVYLIQTDKKYDWKSMATKFTNKEFQIPAERGNIYSSDDKLLATSVPYFELHIDFGSQAMTDQLFKRNVDSLAYYMWKEFGEQSKQTYKLQLIKARKQKRRYFPLCKKADYSLLKEIKQWPLLREGKFKGGLIVEIHQERRNPFGVLARRTIGLVRDSAKSVGLEEAADSLLSGKAGRIMKQKIAGGEWIPIKSAREIEPRNGYDVVSTIDVGLQDIAQSTLMQAAVTYKADFASAILMEVSTGAIKAIVNLTKTGKDSAYSEVYNNAIAMRYEPGSVFKTAAYLALFDDGLISPNDSINTDHASTVFAGVKLTDDGHNTQYTYLTPCKALAISSNVAIAKWINKYYAKDRKGFYEKLQQFGLTEPAHIDLKGELPPVVYKPEKWSALSLPWMAHGYELKFTPLQILTFYNAIANNGKRMKPYLVQEVQDNGKTIRQSKPQATQHKICSPQAAQWAKEILLCVVEDENGTARKIQTPHYRIAGKTGTAKMSMGGSGYSEKNLSTFVGFFPADAPLYSCIVVIGGAEGPGTTGGVVSAPVFRVMADKIITSNIKSNLAINKDTLRANQPVPKWAASVEALKSIQERFNIRFDFKEDWEYAYTRSGADKKAKVGKLESAPGKVPDVRGMSLDDAVYLLENKGLKIGFSGKGKVIAQSLLPGTTVVRGTYIELVLG